MSARLPACSVLILAGGRGARMGGRDKGLLEWRGEPLVAHVQRVVRPLTDDVVISCNRNQELYRGYADRLVADAEADYPGPLAGVIAGLAMARHDWVVVLGCDAPLIDRRLIEDLLGLAVGQDLPAMVRQGGYWQPMFAVLPRRVGLDCAVGDPRLSNFNTPELLGP
ncbi:molybdenum cofactor guanylyltransferase MobA [Pseudomonas putida]|uniref:Molybdenum cofactor guanylyltransferase MobA n=1 Tax=Pseudomonas putida TaxID=303 RepID=A0A2S3WFC5_PSEPU|nr:molybdenum cofactor guanylyltransferase MobA [Pseudomonas putida]POF89338.1 molybdenum cofactor guanylyltransferase MobA [Pseudomonas putida]